MWEQVAEGLRRKFNYIMSKNDLFFFFAWTNHKQNIFSQGRSFKNGLKEFIWDDWGVDAFWEAQFILWRVHIRLYYCDFTDFIDDLLALGYFDLYYFTEQRQRLILFYPNVEFFQIETWKRFMG